ncbi:hypothetical protein HF325_000796 [Metschnikowia pulcherrima]|uniref:Uncharacterized protein n=1 Tax=Metschnikowia pulcherrima TaxID=27326 RepID=A0A8H7LEA3_9ASCO|nr:hypothetical protein HF325_000796 [Metschnikowia pulcherrima]
MSQGSNIIGKLFKKEKKEEKILHDLERAGEKRGQYETGKAASSTSKDASTIASNEEVYHGNTAAGPSGVTPSGVKSDTHKGQGEVIGASGAAGTVAGASAKHHGIEGQTAYGASHGHQSRGSDSSSKYSASSKGHVVSHPPPVNRQPLDQTYGGDYADGKNPTELSTYSATNEKDKALVDNDRPRYDNDAKPAKGQGQFYDPKDTQGRLYKTEGVSGKSNQESGHAPIGAAAAAASSALAGGVAKGEYGDDTEATHAQLLHKDLKTKPAVYASEEAARKHAEEVETEAYNAGRNKGLKEAKLGHGQSQTNHGGHKESLDPKSEHSKNKSAFNEGGLAGATAEAKHGHSQTPSKSAAKTFSGSDAGKDTHKRDAESKETYGKDTHGQDSGFGGNQNPLGAGVGAGVGTGAAAGAAVGAHKHHESHQKQKTLDPSIDHPALTGQVDTHLTGPVAVAAEQKARSGETASAKTTGYDQQIKRLDQSIAETQREIDALGGATGSAAGTSHSAPSSDHSVNPAHSTGHHEHGSTKGNATHTSSDIETAAYNAGHAKGFTSNKLTGIQSKSTGETTESSDPGLFGGVAGAASAVGALAASAVGLGHEDHKDNSHGQHKAVGSTAYTDSVTQDDGTLNPDLENSLYNAGYTKGQAEHDHKLQNELEAGYLDSAKAAIASAGVAAASAFGYEGYNTYYNDEQHSKDVEKKHEYADNAAPNPNRSAASKIEKPALEKHDDAQSKPSTTGSTAQHPGATATSGVAALAKDKDSERLPESRKGTKPTSREPTTLRDTEKSGSGSGIGSAVSGAVAGAASAVGLTKGSAEHHKVDSLVEEAAADYDDVRKEPRHKTKGGVLEETETTTKKTDLPEDPSKKDSSEAETSGVDNTKLEEDIAAYNKKHGFTHGKSLVEVAEEAHPEIKQAPAHRDDDEDTPRQRTDLSKPATGAATGIAATVAGQKLAQSDHSSHQDKSARGIDSRENKKAEPVGDAVTGKSKGESKEIEAAAFKAGKDEGRSSHDHHSRPHQVVNAATGKTREESKEIEEAATRGKSVNTNPAHGSHLQSHHSADVASEKPKHESRAVEGAAFAAGANQAVSHHEEDSHSEPVANAAVGKSRQESTEIENAAHLRSGAFPVTNAATGKSRDESKEIEEAAFAAKLGSAHAGTTNTHPWKDAAAGKGKGESKSHPVTDAAVGKPRQESREIENAAYAAGHKPHTSSTQTGAGLEKELYDAGFKHGSSSHGHPSSHGSGADEARPIVEVIGISDRDEAQKVAQQTTRELMAKGEDLSGSKIVIDANKKEVYKQAQTGVPESNKAHQKSTTGAGAAAAAGAGISRSAGHGDGETSRKTQPDASFHDSQREVDGSKNHRDHEKVKDKLEHEAEKGNLGNVSAEGPEHQTHTSKSVGSGAIFSEHGEGYGRNSSTTQPDASFFDPAKEVDGGANHRAHEKVKSTLEREAEKGHLGNISSDSGSPRFRNELPGKEVTYTEVTILGEPDTQRAQLLANEAVGSLKGRRDIIGVKELHVDAYTGAICDQEGRFVAQLSQRRLSQADIGVKRKSSGGLVHLPSESSGHGTSGAGTKTYPVADHQRGIDHNSAHGDKQNAGQGPFSGKYDISSAQTSAKTDGGRMPGAFA